MKLPAASFIAGVSGFLALAHEILWVRVYAFATAGAADAFGLLLAAYLAGLGIGSWLAARWCRGADAPQRRPLQMAGIAIAGSSLAAFLAAPLAAWLVSSLEVKPGAILPVFGLASAGLGVVLPLLCHQAIPPDERSGSRLSWVYAGNILGSTLGSLATGLWLLDALTLRELNATLAVVGLVLGACILAAQFRTVRGVLCLGAALAAAVGIVAVTAKPLYRRLYERLLYQGEFAAAKPFAETIEGRSGVVNVTWDGVVYGGGSYDGMFNLSPLPEEDDNRVLRAYLVAAFHPAPREVLMIGLGSGSWLQVLANYPLVERVTVVEINPGFVEAVRREPRVAGALLNPKVEIVIDDGRRFLRRTPRQFDLIVQNTIVYWRAHATSLLSREYLELSRRHLKPGGVLYFNTTMSTAAQKTGATVFPHAVRFQNMLIASDQPVTIDRARFQAALDAWRIGGEPVLPPGRAAAALDLLKEQDWRGGPTWEDRESILRRTVSDPVITDDNMATEWRAKGTYP
jgi:predicted membrane-bound spermidine synthase